MVWKHGLGRWHGLMYAVSRVVERRAVLKGGKQYRGVVPVDPAILPPKGTEYAPVRVAVTRQEACTKGL